MTKLFAVVGLAVVGLQGCSYCTAPKASEAANTVPTTSDSPVAASTPSRGQDSYEIRWEGEVGSKLGVYYNLSSPNQPIKKEDFDVVLPKTVKFSAPIESDVLAGGFSSENKDFSVKIFRNGKDCGEVISIKNGKVSPARSCRYP